MEVQAGFGDRGTRYVQHLVEQSSQIRFLQLELDGLGEIEESLDGPVETVNFAIQHLEGLLRLRTGRHVGLENFQPQAHGVERVFHFVRDACCHAAERVELFRLNQL